ncbi:M20/M25/M40 family metallo-hydrolase [Deinococcus budaensis]|uniref:Zn-dependent M28 family amino/carboxypeptidase n=1 Tax=Deinococcus budaensis TaxID=1665626 RepID=A0A7W8GFV9_9DEIO|nr:M20/M25/M40 family metallo-hydrolase [Deinococcus budaensis]MBB5234584.1 Zn-dependent M28 family amino/carboxypeptidase [Deinococcus budaensis]
MKQGVRGRLWFGGVLTLSLAACGQPQPSLPAGADPYAGGVSYPWSYTAPAGKLGALSLTPGQNNLYYEPILAARNAWGPIEIDRSNGERAAGDGRTITLDGKTYQRGFGTHAGSELRFSLQGTGAVCTRFTADIGVDDEVGNRGSVVFQVFLDNEKVYDSGTMTGASTTKTVDVNVAGKGELRLVVTDAGDGIHYDHADWARPLISCLPDAPLNLTASLRGAVTPEGVRRHLDVFQRLADNNGGNRAAHLPGYAASAAYVQRQLEAAGYSVRLQPFTYPVFLDRSALAQTAPTARTLIRGQDFTSMTFSPEGQVSGQVQGVDLTLPPPPAPSSTSGCEAGDFAGFTRGNIALVQRGTCSFAQKALNAQAAGATAVIVFNEGQPGRTGVIAGTLGGADSGVTIPVLGASFEVGRALNGASADLKVEIEEQQRTTTNVIADTQAGRTDHVVVVGAHLDSVEEGPGINDNGSGSAAILETALQMAKLGIQPRNQVRFAFWGAEEEGLLGSEYYVAQLGPEAQANIALNLNFDMVGSPNFARFVYDGDGSDSQAGPPGSDTIERVFVDYFETQGLASRPTEFSGRSDYGPFIGVGIPAGGLFTGAEGRKTPEEAALFGGAAGVAYDPCYHQACDTLANVNVTALDQMSDAAAHAILYFAQATDTLRGLSAQTARRPLNTLTYKGNRLLR